MIRKENKKEVNKLWLWLVLVIGFVKHKFLHVFDKSHYSFGE